MEEWHRGAKSEIFLTPEGSWWYMLIPRDCTARHDQTIIKYLYHAQNANDVELPKVNPGKACREYCKHRPEREARYISPLIPHMYKLF